MQIKKDDLFSLNKKAVLITGGFGLLGSELVQSCLAGGAHVAILDVRPNDEKLRRFRNISSRVRFYRGDIASPQVRKVIGTVISDMQAIHVLVNNAYPRNRHYGRIFEAIQLKDWQVNVDRHLGGYFNITQLVANQMKKQCTGSIVNIGSIYGMVAPDFSIYQGTKMTMPAEYSAIKGGLLNFTRYLATYLAPHGIRVNAVSPGGIKNGQDPKFVRNYCRRVPLGRMAAPEDVSGAVVFLASDASRYITGQNIAVDGGWTAW